MEEKKILVLTEEEKIERIEEILEGMDDSDLVDEWNRLCSCSDDEVHPMEEIDEEFEGYTVREAHEWFDLDRIDFSDAWYRKVGANFETSNYPTDFIEIPELAQLAFDRDDDLGESKIREILDAPDHDEVEEEEDELDHVEQTEQTEEEQKDKELTLSITEEDLRIMLKALDVLLLRVAHAKHDISEECALEWSKKGARAWEKLRDIEMKLAE